MRRFVEKPDPGQITTDTINAGAYILDRGLLDRIPAGRVVSIEREFFPGLLADTVPFYGWIGDHYWLDIGNAEKYRQGQLDLLAGRVRARVAPDGAGGEAAAAAGGVAVEPGARIQAPVVLGRGCRLAADSRVGPGAVLGPGCSIAPRRSWRRRCSGKACGSARARAPSCVVANNASIGARVKLGPGAVVAAGTILPDDSRL